jgi:hypothetical protein
LLEEEDNSAIHHAPQIQLENEPDSRKNKQPDERGKNEISINKQTKTNKRTNKQTNKQPNEQRTNTYLVDYECRCSQEYEEQEANRVEQKHRSHVPGL